MGLSRRAFAGKALAAVGGVVGLASAGLPALEQEATTAGITFGTDSGPIFQELPAAENVAPTVQDIEALLEEGEHIPAKQTPEVAALLGKFGQANAYLRAKFIDPASGLERVQLRIASFNWVNGVLSRVR